MGESDRLLGRGWQVDGEETTVKRCRGGTTLIRRTRVNSIYRGSASSRRA